jgi:hypothetical protein
MIRGLRAMDTAARKEDDARVILLVAARRVKEDVRVAAIVIIKKLKYEVGSGNMEVVKWWCASVSLDNSHDRVHVLIVSYMIGLNLETKIRENPV